MKKQHAFEWLAGLLVLCWAACLWGCVPTTAGQCDPEFNDDCICTDTAGQACEPEPNTDCSCTVPVSTTASNTTTGGDASNGDASNGGTSNGATNTSNGATTGTSNNTTGSTTGGTTGPGTTGGGTSNGTTTVTPPFMCDTLADGDAPQSPTALADGSAAQENTCANDVDWYAIGADKGCNIDIALDSAQPLMMGLWRKNGDIAFEVAPTDVLSFTVPRDDEVVLLLVNAPADADEKGYTITPTITCQPLTCDDGADDLFEDNDDFSSGDNPAVITPGDSFTASMCAAGSEVFARYDSYTIEDDARYQGCVLASRVTWPVMNPQYEGSTTNRGYYRNYESLDVDHSLGDSDGGPYQTVLRATWRLGDFDTAAEFFDLPIDLLVIPELEPSRYLDPVNDFEPDRTTWQYQRASYALFPADYHVVVQNASYSEDGTAVFPEYDVELRALCDFSCAPRPGDMDFGIPEGDDWYDAYTGLGGGLAPDLAFDAGGRFGGFLRGIACPTSPYNGYIEGSFDDRTFATFPADIDSFDAGSFGKGYVDGALVNHADCTATIRVEWEGDHKPHVAWTTTHNTNLDQEAWTYDPAVSTTNDAQNPFYTHALAASSFSAHGWKNAPPESLFTYVEGDNWMELRAGTDLLAGPTQTTGVSVAIANNPSNGDAGTPWSARYYCQQDGLPQ